MPTAHTKRVSERVRTGVRVEGVVQGVGFRQFVYSLASSLGLGGHVGNDGVFAEVEGSARGSQELGPSRHLHDTAPAAGYIGS
jgi:hydrogenase maturation factor HypF (carbamoyltransferase family)